MKVHVTLDMLDGAASRSRVVYLDELDTMWLRLKLCEPGVASITITRADLLTLLRKATDVPGDS